MGSRLEGEQMSCALDWCRVAGVRACGASPTGESKAQYLGALAQVEGGAAV
jgi:hypothetical protein